MPAPNETRELLRADDLLTLRFEFVNLTLDTAATRAPRLLRARAAQPAFVIVHFPPQHIVEQTFHADDGGGLPDLTAPPVGALLADPSRLVFKVPDDRGDIPFTAASLLTCMKTFELKVAANAQPPNASAPGTDDHPEVPSSQIEVPYRLLLSPDRTGRWEHALEPVTREARTELWHTRLGITRNDGKPGLNESGATLRAIGLREGAAPSSVTLSRPTAQDRADIVALCSDFTIPIGSVPTGPGLAPQRIHYVPKPLEVDHFMLTALGASMHVHSAWNFPEPNSEGSTFSLSDWRQIVAVGRDQYVRLVNRGFLFPFGHRASKFALVERTLEASPSQSGESVAYLTQREFIVVQEPEKDYRRLASAYGPHQGRQMPLKSVRIATLVTPNLDLHAEPDFFPEVRRQLFRFHILARDWEEQTCEFFLPLLFVSGVSANPQAPGKLSPLSAEEIKTQVAAAHSRYSDVSRPEQRLCDMKSQKVAVADSPDKPGRATLNVVSMSFGAISAGSGLNLDGLPAGHPPFLPTLESAAVTIPAVDNLLGSAGGAPPTRITLHEDYLQNGFGRDDVDHLFAAMSQPLSLAFPADKSGGLVTPNMAMDALSRNSGPIATALLGPHPAFPPMEGANLLGMRLTDVIDLADPTDGINPKTFDGMTPAEIEATLAKPGVTTKAPILITVTGPGSVETRFLWKPQIKDFLDTFNVRPKDDAGVDVFADKAQLIVRTTMSTSVGNDAVFRVQGTLKSFGLTLAGVIQLNFEEVKFVAEKGKKLDFKATLHAANPIEFQGALQFVNTLRNIIPPSGFSNSPNLAVGPEGITAGYALGIPSLGIGLFSLQNLALSSRLSLPFTDTPTTVRFAVSERQHPFLVTVSLFGGGGFFAIEVGTQGIVEMEAAIEFGGNIALDLIVASGSVYVLAGLYFSITGHIVDLKGYLRCGGYLEVLSLISVSVEFYLELDFLAPKTVSGSARLTVSVAIGCFEKSVSLSVEKSFVGGDGDPTFEQTVSLPQWTSYCGAFA